ncbi:isochorismatase family protein (plasmid) [Leisingera sp. M527]|uniref:isochorismatase family protein n=1 Tax=Leisingera sp. M527 TaxID=2867014 RepID=UPI0021A37D92|nr:isochorismatase family protein [Leisingera sp. M527]UWQ35332.1 isochorismatase family protein [Leisingera sp. M527]
MAHKRYSPENAALLLIDHQIGTAGWMHSGSVKEMKRNTLALAKAAAALGMPVILTSSLENEAQGPLFPELETILPEAYANRIRRLGTVDSMADPNFHNAVKATGRKNLIMAGLLTEVCVLYPALSAVEEGYDVQVIADASGSGTKAGDDFALARVRQAGGYVAGTIQILAELVEDWTTGAGPIVQAVSADLYAAAAAADTENQG